MALILPHAKSFSRMLVIMWPTSVEGDEEKHSFEGAYSWDPRKNPKNGACPNLKCGEGCPKKTEHGIGMFIDRIWAPIMAHVLVSLPVILNLSALML